MMAGSLSAGLEKNNATKLQNKKRQRNHTVPVAH